MAGLLMTGMLGSALAQIDLSKMITGNQTSPESIAAIHYGAEGKLIWIFYHAPSLTDPKTKEKRAERRAVEREKRDADLRGKTRKMPPSGKAALDAIKNGC